LQHLNIGHRPDARAGDHVAYVLRGAAKAREAIAAERTPLDRGFAVAKFRLDIPTRTGPDAPDRLI